MFVGIVRMELFISYVHSLKEKRQVLKKIMDNVRNKFPVSVSEVEDHDLWQKAVVGFAVVSNESVQIERMIQKITDLIDSLHVCDILETRKEIFPW